MPPFKDIIKTYNCGSVKISRNERFIRSPEKRRCFGYVEEGYCSALTEQLCKTKGRCPFWKERESYKERDYDY